MTRAGNFAGDGKATEKSSNWASEGSQSGDKFPVWRTSQADKLRCTLIIQPCTHSGSLVPPRRAAPRRHPDSFLQDSLNGVGSCGLWKIAAEWDEQRERTYHGRKNNVARTKTENTPFRISDNDATSGFFAWSHLVRWKKNRSKGARGQKPRCKRVYGPHRAETSVSSVAFPSKGFFCLGKDTNSPVGDTCARPFLEE